MDDKKLAEMTPEERALYCIPPSMGATTYENLKVIVGRLAALRDADMAAARAAMVEEIAAWIERFEDTLRKAAKAEGGGP